MFFKKNKKSLLMLAIALGSILVSSFAGSLIQSKGYSIEITDLRGEENAGQYIDPTTGLAVDGVQVKGNVEFKNVSFSYKQSKEVVKNLSFVLFQFTSI